MRAPQRNAHVVTGKPGCAIADFNSIPVHMWASLHRCLQPGTGRMSIDVDGGNLGGPGHPWKFLTRPTSKAVPAEVCALPAEPTRPLQNLARRKGRPLRQLTADSSSRRRPPPPSRCMCALPPPPPPFRSRAIVGASLTCAARLRSTPSAGCPNRGGRCQAWLGCNRITTAKLVSDAEIESHMRYLA